jgi:hypothetical protein
MRQWTRSPMKAPNVSDRFSSRPVTQMGPATGSWVASASAQNIISYRLALIVLVPSPLAGEG